MPTIIKRKGAEIDLDTCEPYTGDDWISIVNEVKVADEGIVTHSFKTPAEIRKEIDAKLDFHICECGHEFKAEDYDEECPNCGGSGYSRNPVIDEYSNSCHFGANEFQPIAPRDWFRYSINVWCEPGANEGHSVYVTVLFFRDYEPIIAKNVYRIKTFQGMQYAHDTVKRIMKLMGVWNC